MYTSTKPNREEILLDEDRNLYRDRWVDTQIAADALGVSKDHLYKSVRRGHCTIRTQRIGNLLRFSAKDLGILEDGED